MSSREPAVNKDTFGGDFLNALLLRPVYRKPLEEEPEPEPEAKSERFVTFYTPNGVSMVGTGISLHIAIRPNDIAEINEYQSLAGLMCSLKMKDGTTHYVYDSFESVMEKLNG